MALAHLAGHVHVGEEVHLDADDAVALAGLAPAALDVKGEPAGGKAPHLGLLGGGEQLPDVVEEPGVGGGVGPGGPADGGLVDLDHLVQVLQPQQLLVLPRVGVGPVQLRRQLFVEDLVDKAGLPRPGDPGDAHELPQGDLHVDPLQVVLGGALDLQEFPAARAAGFGDFHLPLAAQILPGQGLLALLDALGGPGVDNLSPVDARPRAHVHDVVRLPHGVLVVLHHDDRVAQVPQPLQGV